MISLSIFSPFQLKSATVCLLNFYYFILSLWLFRLNWEEHIQMTDQDPRCKAWATNKSLFSLACQHIICQPSIRHTLIFQVKNFNWQQMLLVFVTFGSLTYYEYRLNLKIFWKYFCNLNRFSNKLKIFLKLSLKSLYDWLNPE